MMGKVLYKHFFLSSSLPWRHGLNQSRMWMWDVVKIHFSLLFFFCKSRIYDTRCLMQVFVWLKSAHIPGRWQPLLHLFTAARLFRVLTWLIRVQEKLYHIIILERGFTAQNYRELYVSFVLISWVYVLIKMSAFGSILQRKCLFTCLYFVEKNNT